MAKPKLRKPLWPDRRERKRPTEHFVSYILQTADNQITPPSPPVKGEIGSRLKVFSTISTDPDMLLACGYNEAGASGRSPSQRCWL